MPGAEIFRWPLASCQLFDELDLVFPLQTVDEDQANRLGDAKRVLGLVDLLRRYDPAIRSVESSIVPTAQFEIFARHVATMPYALQISVRYPELMTSDEIRRRKFLLMRVLLTL